MAIDYKLKMVFAMLLPHLSSIIGAILSVILKRDNTGINSWFSTLTQPYLSPPNWVFIPVWAILYTAMGYASYLVYRDANGLWNDKSRVPISLYVVQLALNWLWPIIFFSWHSLLWSLVEIIVLLVAIIACTIAFHKVNKAAGLLFIPYLVWTIFATYLNYSLYRLNPDK